MSALGDRSEMPITTAMELPGMGIGRSLGICFGLVVRSMGLAKNFTAGFSALRQGEVSQYTELLEDSRRHAVDRMIENAQLLGANAIVGMRFDSSEMGQQLTEIVAYGTAVVVERVV
ncbi:MAG: heavy metal-binding domain-containing protein [Actinobacteria bacterium]|nr:heavy metal-binding domain-containing protein [Actinomycetota bacterium]